MYLGDHLLRHLSNKECIYSTLVTESSIVSPSLSLEIYKEISHPKKPPFFSPHADGDFLDRLAAESPDIVVDADKFSLLGTVDESYVFSNSTTGVPWNYCFLLQNKNVSPLAVCRAVIKRVEAQKMCVEKLGLGIDTGTHWVHAFKQNVFFSRNASLYVLRRLGLTVFDNIGLKDVTRKRFLQSHSTSLQDLNDLLADFESYCAVSEGSLFFNKNQHRARFFRYISGNPNLSSEFLEKHIHEPWDWHRLSSNPSFPVSYILENLDTPQTPGCSGRFAWKINHLCLHPRLTMDTVLRRSHLPWDLRLLCINKNISIAELEKLPAPIFDALFETKYIFMNEFWDRETFEKYHKKYKFSDQQILYIFSIKRSWVKRVRQKQRMQNTFYDELMAFTWRPSRLERWIWDTDTLKDWEQMPE